MNGIEHLLGKVHNGGNLAELKKLPDNSIHSVVTDPPYGLKFMGKSWDYDVPQVETWREVLRVLKPGGYLLSFGGSRTYHRIVVNIEDAGFEIRDQIGWCYGSGFPKSHDISKGIDKQAGIEREKIPATGGLHKNTNLNDDNWSKIGNKNALQDSNNPASEPARQWQGWGTALKPAVEPICMARKPISEATVAANVLKWGTGGINIDGCRIGTEELTYGAMKQHMEARPWSDAQAKGERGKPEPKTVIGRWPANLIHDGSEEVLAGFPDTGISRESTVNNAGSIWGSGNNENRLAGFNDCGSAARFFYTAKASKWDRNEDVLDGSCTIKYNIPKDLGGIPCNVVNTVLVQLLKKVISDSEVLKWHTAENGVSIMGQCQSGFLSTILTEINKITKSEISNLLTLSHIKEFIQGANLYPVNGGSPAENVEKLKWSQQITTQGSQAELVRGVNLVALQMLSVISVKENWKPTSNTHNTVKPTDLMQYLCRLVTPPDGIILDPYAGSGSTGKAALLECFRFIGFEREAEYCKIANARMAFVKGQLKLF